MGSLTNIPEPIIPPKYQASSVMSSLFLAGLPPGKSSRMLQRKQRIAKGMRVIPKHFAKFPEHMFQSFFFLISNSKKVPVHGVQNLFLNSPLFQGHFPTSGPRWSEGRRTFEHIYTFAIWCHHFHVRFTIFVALTTTYLLMFYHSMSLPSDFSHFALLWV